MSEYRCNTEGCSVGDCENCLAVADLRAQLADAKAWRNVNEPDAQLWRKVYASACSIAYTDEKLGLLVRLAALDYYETEKPRMKALIDIAEREAARSTT